MGADSSMSIEEYCEGIGVSKRRQEGTRLLQLLINALGMSSRQATRAAVMISVSFCVKLQEKISRVSVFNRYICSRGLTAFSIFSPHRILIDSDHRSQRLSHVSMSSNAVVRNGGSDYADWPRFVGYDFNKHGYLQYTDFEGSTLHTLPLDKSRVAQTNASLFFSPLAFFSTSACLSASVLTSSSCLGIRSCTSQTTLSRLTFLCVPPPPARDLPISMRTREDSGRIRFLSFPSPPRAVPSRTGAVTMHPDSWLASGFEQSHLCRTARSRCGLGDTVIRHQQSDQRQRIASCC